MPLWVPGSKTVLTHQAEGDKEPREMYLTILGPDSPDTRRVLTAAKRRADQKDDDKDESNEQIEASKWTDCKAIARLTVGGLVFWDGKWVEIDQKNAAQLYKLVPAFRGQALSFAIDPGNYIGG